MKTRMIMLAIVLSAASQAIASGQMTTPFTASTNINGKATFKSVNTFIQTRTKNSNQPRYIEGLNTRPWGAGTGWHPAQSAFPDELTYEARFNLVWFGAKPSP